MSLLILIQGFILAFIPISELRGAIPFLYFSGYSLLVSFIVAVLGNLLVIPIELFFLDVINGFFLKNSISYNDFFHHHLERARVRLSRSIEKYEYVGLTILVALPIPIIGGAYTGILGAWAIGMDRKKTIIYSAIGIIISGIIVSLVLFYGLNFLSFFINKNY